MIIQSKQKLILIATVFLPAVLLLGGALRVLAGANRAVVATDVGGVLTSNTTWTIENSPYIVTQTIGIPTGITLTIEAGATVIATDSPEDSSGLYPLFVQTGGHLEAIGTSDDPIVFTSFQDSAAGEWTAIYIAGSANLQHTNFRYSEFNVVVEGASDEPIVIQDSLFSNSSDVGMEIAVEALHRMQLLNNEFANNAQNSIRIFRYYDGEQLTDDVVLQPQIGLDGYLFEDYHSMSYPRLIVPEEITLTLQAGTTLLMPKNGVLEVHGHLLTTGNSDNLVHIMGTPELVANEEKWTAVSFNEETSSGEMVYTTIQHAIEGISLYTANGGNVVMSDSKIANGDVAILTTPLRCIGYKWIT